MPEWQPLTGTEPMSEDCLASERLDAEATRGGTRPVMVWLHGGGYTGGSPAALPLRRRQPRAAARRGRRQHHAPAERARLHSSRRSSAASGSPTRATPGMKDIVAGLEWVRDNIDGFGGDPKQRHDLRPVGRRRKGEHAARHAGGAGAVSSRDRAERIGGDEHAGGSTATQNAEALMSRLGLKAERRQTRCRSCRSIRCSAAMQPPGGGRGGFATSPVVDGALAAARCVQSVGDAAVGVDSAADRVDRDRSDVERRTPITPRPRTSARCARASSEPLRVDAGRARSAGRRLPARPAECEPARPRADHRDRRARSSAPASISQAERKSARGASAGLHVPLPVVLAGERRTAARDALHGHPVRLRQHRQQRVDRRHRADRQRACRPHERAWVAFARSGDPNHDALPRWKPFTRAIARR